MSTTWQERAEQWRRFAAWEAEQLAQGLGRPGVLDFYRACLGKAGLSGP